MDRADHREERAREAIAKTGQKLREASGGRMTQTEAEARVRKARVRGDLIRSES